MDILKMQKEAYKKRKEFVSTPKKCCEVTIHHFAKPLKRKKFRGTEYVYYECVFHKINNKEIPYGKHVLQLSFKVAWLQLFHYLELNNSLELKDIRIFIVKKDNYHYIFNTTLNTIHNELN